MEDTLKALKEHLETNKTKIIKELQSLLTHKKQQLQNAHPWARDILDRISDFTRNGKYIRGNLVLLGASLNKTSLRKAHYQLAAAMELVHVCFLIHDDIIDQDPRRRGKTTIHTQYQKWAQSQQLPNPPHFGISMGICAGDFDLFFLYEVINDLDLDSKIKNKLCRLISQESQEVILGQMQDVYLGHLPHFDIQEQTIENMYRYKTARYTYSLPLALGAISSRLNPEKIEYLMELGECMGLIFQIKDDELDLFADPRKTGKILGSDILENKKTLLFIKLFQKAPPKTKKHLNFIFEKKSLGLQDIEFVKNQLQKLGIVEELHNKMDNLSNKILNILDNLKVPLEHKNFLKQLINYNRYRET